MAKDNRDVVILVHGVGDHQINHFESEVTDTLSWLSTQYGLEKFEDKFNVIPIEYDSIFRQILENARAVTDDMPIGNDRKLLDFIESYSDRVSKDNYYTSHALDAAVYYSFLAGAVEAHVGTEYFKIYNKFVTAGHAKKCHIIAHSLGTTVIHNVLHRLYHTKDIDKQKNWTGGDYKYLHPVANKIDSLIQISNVSRLYPRPIDPYKSVVNSHHGGMCRLFLNIKHSFDLIALVKDFDPKNWGEHSGYLDVAFNEIVDLKKLEPTIFKNSKDKLDVHAIQHYLAAPQVHLPLLRILYSEMYSWPSKKLKDKYETKWRKASIQAQLSELKNLIAELNPSDLLSNNVDDLKRTYEGIQKFFS